MAEQSAFLIALIPLVGILLTGAFGYLLLRTQLRATVEAAREAREEASLARAAVQVVRGQQDKLEVSMDGNLTRLTKALEQVAHAAGVEEGKAIQASSEAAIQATVVAAVDAAVQGVANTAAPLPVTIVQQPEDAPVRVTDTPPEGA